MALDRQEEDLQTASGKAAEVYRDIYERAVQENALGSLETTKAIVDRMGEYGYCAIDQENKNQVNLTHVKASLLPPLSRPGTLFGTIHPALG